MIKGVFQIPFTDKKNMATDENQPEVTFIPSLYLKDVGIAMEFYKSAFGVKERWRVENENGSIHVAEVTLGTVKLRMHEKEINDGDANADEDRKTIVLGLLTKAPEELAARAVRAGAKVLSPVKMYEYGYRQGTLKDPFGYYWCLEGNEGLTSTPQVQK
jgi:PhnB protein